jgi:hypothetical protein
MIRSVSGEQVLGRKGHQSDGRSSIAFTRSVEHSESWRSEPRRLLNRHGTPTLQAGRIWRFYGRQDVVTDRPLFVSEGIVGARTLSYRS